MTFSSSTDLIPSSVSLKELLSSGNGSDSEVEACPELYKGLEYDPPYHSHAFEAECNNKVPLKMLVTFLVDASLYTHSDLEALLEAIVSRWVEGEGMWNAAASVCLFVSLWCLFCYPDFISS